MSNIFHTYVKNIMSVHEFTDEVLIQQSLLNILHKAIFSQIDIASGWHSV